MNTDSTEEGKWEIKKSRLGRALQLLKLELNVTNRGVDYERKKEDLENTLYFFISDINHHFPSCPRQILSRREKEVLYYSSIGKTYEEIGLILGIKLSTVKFHIGNTVSKLGVLNSRQAIGRAVELQIIKKT